MRRRRRQPVGVIAGTLSLNWLTRLVLRFSDRAGHAAMVLDPATGAVIGRSPGNDIFVGRRFVDRAFLQTLESRTGGVAEATDLSGARMIYGFAPLRIGERNLVVAVGIARADLVGRENRRLMLGGLLGLAALLLAILLAWTTSRVVLIRPLAGLAATAERLGGGDLTIRAPTATWVRELRRLGLTFNRMAARLQRRQQQLESLQGELAASETMHRILATNATDVIARLGADFRRTYISPACREVLGYEPGEMIGRPFGGKAHPDDLPRLQADFIDPLRAGGTEARAAYRSLRKDGSTLWVESRARRLPDGTGYVVVTSDISDRKALEEQLAATSRQLEQMAVIDPLTGLANRRRFEAVLSEEQRRAARLRLPIALLLAEPDRFEAYRDAYGSPRRMSACERWQRRSTGCCGGPETWRRGSTARASRCCCRPPTRWAPATWASASGRRSARSRSRMRRHRREW